MPTTRKPQPRRKIVYHFRNWKAYEWALVQRGSLTLWIDEEVRRQWHYAGPAQRGALFTYIEVAVEAMLSLKEVFHLPNRATEGLGRSIMNLLEVDVDVPDHTTLSRRGKTLQVRLPKKACGPLQLVLDSRGLKAYGEGEYPEYQF